MAKLLELLARERRILDQGRELKDLRSQVDKLRTENERMRKAMRRCVTCDYRIEVVGRRSAAPSAE